MCVTKSMIGVYFESWAMPWTDQSDRSELAKVDKPIDTVFLSFALPNCTYRKGQMSWAGTGLNFSSDFKVVRDAISLLRQKGIKVLLAVGGASYAFTPYNAVGCADLANDLGCAGLDIDWEPSDGYASRSKLAAIITDFRQAIGSTKLLTMATFGLGCATPNGDSYRGLNIDGILAKGHLLDWVNIMAYDGGKDLNVIDCYESTKKVFPKPVMLGFQVGKQGWGDALLTMNDVNTICKYIAPKKDGCFVWAYFKQGPPSAKEVCATAATWLNNATESTVSFNCPNCNTKLSVTK